LEWALHDDYATFWDTHRPDGTEITAA